MKHVLKNTLSAERILSLEHRKPNHFWTETGHRQAIALFHAAAERVPAYKNFLKKKKINPTKIQTWSDFTAVPPVDKENYLKRYPLNQLCWDGTLRTPLVFTSTSGSTGAPFYFPRWHSLDWQYSVMIESYLKESSYGTKGPVLVIIGFGMGVWIGGLITYKAFEIAAQRLNYPISIITPGVNKNEIFEALRSLAPQFQQTLLVGYPPFIKDLVDEAEEQGINLKKLNIRLLCAAEAFTEKFRDYMVENAGINNLFRDTRNIYGSADIGAMAYETPVAILARRLVMANKKLFTDLLGPIIKTPTLAQYNPLFILFEAPEGEITLTGNNAVPLIRYQIKDHGGAFDFITLDRILSQHGINLTAEIKAAGLSRYASQLPFVYVYERSDFSVKLHLRDVHPEIIRDTLIDKPIDSYLTGKFTIATKYNENHDQYLEINLEMQKNKKMPKAVEKLLERKILKALGQKTSGPGNQADFIKRPGLIKTVFWPHEHSIYFKPGNKQKWVIK